MVSPPKCVSCKGKLRCGRLYCPNLVRSEVMFKSVEATGKEFSGNSPPSVFVGSKMYPNLNVGILSPPQNVEKAWLYDAQTHWAKNNFDIKQVIFYRSNLINSRFNTPVKSVRSSHKFLDFAKEIAMAMKPVSLEIELEKKVKLSLDYDNTTLPMGPRAPLKKVRITENTKIAQKVDKVVSDTDLKAAGALNYLYKSEFDEHTLSKLLSIGVLGLKKNRKLVPTRWSITTVDDNLGKNLIKQIRDFNPINNYQLYFGHYLGNYYLILLFPEIFNYELFEMYLPGSAWNPGPEIKISTDDESHFGRKVYASNTVGGYYAARLPILEMLNSVRRQASALVLRFETPDYWCSLGVWVVREAARKTIQQNPITFNSREEMLNEAQRLVTNVLNFDINNIIKRSKLINKIKKQTKLMNWF